MKPILYTLVIIAFSLPLHGETYLLSDLFSPALEEDMQLRKIANETRQINTRLEDSRSAFQPVVSGSLRAAYKSELPEMQTGPVTTEVGVRDTYEAVITAKQLIFAGFARTAAVDAAENAMANQQFLMQTRNDAVRFDLVQSAYAYSLASLSVDSLAASLTRLELNKRKVESFFAQGYASEIDMLDIDSGVTDLKLKLRQKEAERDAALTILRQITGKEDLTSLEIDPSFMDLPHPEEITATEDDIRRNSDLVATEYARRGLEIRMEADKAAFYPRISAFGTLNYGRPGANFFSDQWQFYYTGGIEVSLELWSGGSRSRALERDMAGLDSLKDQQDELYKNLYTQSINTRDNLLALTEQYEMAEKLRSQKKRKYQLVQELWQAGQKSTLEVLESEQEWTESEVMAKTLKIRLLSLYQNYLYLINQPLWDQGERE